MELNRLSSYLRQCFPNGLSYNEAAQLCLHLHCTVTDLPAELQELTERHTLAATFAELARIGWITEQDSPLRALYGAHFHQTTDLGHWIEVIASMYKKGNIRDFAVGKTLAQRLHGNGRGK